MSLTRWRKRSGWPNANATGLDGVAGLIAFKPSQLAAQDPRPRRICDTCCSCSVHPAWLSLKRLDCFKHPKQPVYQILDEIGFSQWRG